MNRMAALKYLRSIIYPCFILLCASCSVTKKVPYFQDIPQGGDSKVLAMSKFTEPVIQTDDILSIQIFSIDPQSTQVSNQASLQSALGTNSASNTGNQTVAGFLVDKNGEVELVGIGKVKLAGLTTYEAKELIRDKTKELYNNVNVGVRFLNFKVTVLGEVNRPAVYTMPNERITLFDALGLAGDLTIFGRRENVLLIREENGKKDFVRFDLNSANVVESSYFYLKQNDVIYVEPNKGKAASLNAARTQTFAIIGSALSVLVVLFSRL